jgi:hypothetical protein
MLLWLISNNRRNGRHITLAYRLVALLSGARLVLQLRYQQSTGYSQGTFLRRAIQLGVVAHGQIKQPSLDKRVSLLGERAAMCGTLLYKLTIHYYTHPWTQQTRHILLSVAWSFKSRRAPPRPTQGPAVPTQSAHHLHRSRRAPAHAGGRGTRRPSITIAKRPSKRIRLSATALMKSSFGRICSKVPFWHECMDRLRFAIEVVRG